MVRSHNRLDPDFIYSLYTGGFKPQLVRIALLIDVFTPLAHGPLDIPSMAKMRSCDEKGSETLLDYLTSLGLLIKEEARYRLTPTAEVFLVKDKKTYAGGWVLMETDPEFWQYVHDRIKGKVTSNGALIIDVPMSADEASAVVSLLTWSLSGGTAHTFLDYLKWLSDVGFKEIKKLSDNWLCATK